MAGFSDIIGHEKETAYLEKAVTTGNVSHAYIFSGEKGVGKKHLATAFAMALQCTGEGNKPCGECHSCHQAKSGNHPDIIYVSHEKPNSVGVDDVRDLLVSDIMVRPYSSKYKIYIIPEAEKMTPAAQNAILKTIEEPPEYAVIILLTENEQLFLDTIRSRCVKLELKPVSDEAVLHYLMETVQIPDYQAKICVAFANGNIGKAVRLASSEDFNEMKTTAMKLVKDIPKMEIHELIEYVKDVVKYKISVQDYLDILALWYRDMVYFKATRDLNGIVFKDEYETIRDAVKICSYEGVEEVMKAIENAKVRLNANVNFDLTLELLFLVIKENIHD